MTQTTEQKIKMAVAIYKGLDGIERQRRLNEVLEASRTNEYAKALYGHFVRAEADIVRDRVRTDKLEQEVRRLSELVRTADNGQRTIYPDNPGRTRTWVFVAGIAGGALAIGYVGMAIVEAVVMSGLLVWIVGAAALALCLSGIDWRAMRTPVEVEQQQPGRVTNIYVTQDGPINITQK